MATITTEKFGDLAFDSKSFLYDYNSQGDKVAGQFKIGGQEYTFIPQNIAEKGIISGDRQRYLGNLLVDDNLKALGTEGVYVDLAGVNNYDTAFEKKGWSTTGFLVPAKVASDRKLVGSVRSYEIGKDLGRGMQMGAIQGVSEIGGKPVYATDSMGKAQSTWIQPPGTSGYDGQNVTGTSHGRYTYTKSKFGLLGEIVGGIGKAVGGIPLLPELIGFATGQPLLAAGLRGAAAGAAGVDPLKAGLMGGLSAAGVQAGLNVQAGLDPITGAAVSPATGGALTLATSTPAPGSFQAALPGLGVQTAATTPGATLLPGSFQAALPSLIAPVNVIGDTAQGLLNQDLQFVGEDAAQLYNTTGSVAATQQNLIAAGVDPIMAAEASNLAALGGTGSSIAGGLGSAFPGETIFTSQGLLAGGSTLDPFAKEMAGIGTASGAGLGISAGDALLGAALLGGGQQQTATGFPQQQAPFQPTGVDYSGIYGLLGQRPSVPGISSLLGPAQLMYPSLLR